MSRPDAARAGSPRLILASRSERRRELLLRLVRSFDCSPAENVDELAVRGPAREVVERLAVLKATEVLDRVLRVRDSSGGGAIEVLGADTLIAVGRGGEERILGKPVDLRDARRMLASLSGRAHRVYTGLAVCRPDGTPQTAVEVTEVTFRPLSEEEIDGYVATGEPLDKAGAYGIQGEGARLVDAIDGCYYNVIGLPLALAASFLAAEIRSDASSCDCASHPLQRGVPRCCRRSCAGG